MEHHASIWAEPRLYVAIAFFLFFVLAGKKIWLALTGILDKRSETIRAELAEAARLRAEADAMLREAQAAQEAATAQAAQLLDGARREATRLAEAARAEAAAASARRERMAMDRIAAAEQAATREVREAAIDIATHAASALLAQQAPAHDAGLIDSAIGNVVAALSGRRAA